jgi:hypothetical protein
MTDAKARLLQMIADEAHMAGGGLLKAVGKAQKVAKAAQPAKAATKIIEAPSIVIPSRLSNLKEVVRGQKGEYGAKRVERAADEIPNLERMYKEEAMRDAFLGENAKALVTMNPADFEKYALTLEKRTTIGPKMAELAKQGEIDKYTLPTDKYIQYLMSLQDGFEHMPYLDIFKDEVGLPMAPKVTGHEGRHRSRALAERGEPSSLVKINPRGDLREGLPRRSQEEYIDALRQELELKNRMIRPEDDTDFVQFPDVYAAGGAVHMAGGGRTPKYPWERYEQPKKVAEMRARKINPVAGAIKSGADYATQLIDKGPSLSNLVGGLVGAVPFVGPDMRKRMEASEISIPTDFNLASNMPAEDYEYGQPMRYRTPGISTTSLPTKDVLEAIKMSDLVGTPGLSKVAEDIGYGQAPDPLDLLDAASVAALGYGAVKAGAKGAKAAKQGALSAAKAAEQFAEKKVPEVMERGGLGAQMLGAFGQNTQSNVIKPVGGNWVSDRLERQLENLKTPTVAGQTPAERIPLHEALLQDKSLNQDQIDRVEHQLQVAKGEAAVDKWVDSNLANYVKKQMATPDDPVRKLAEQGITHKPSVLDDYQDYPYAQKEDRVKAGFPAEGVGQLPLARAWENASDEAIRTLNAGEVQSASQKVDEINKAKSKTTEAKDALEQKFENHVRSFGLKESEVQGLMRTMTPTEKANMVGDTDFEKANAEYLMLQSPLVDYQASMAERNPWISKLDPSSSLYVPHIGDLGFDHITDVLRQDVAAGRIRPEQLNKISMEQAVRRTYEYDQEMAKKMRETQAKVTEGMPVYKEYPEGYKWVELSLPETPTGLPEGWTLAPNSSTEKTGLVRAMSPDGVTVLGQDMPDLVKNVYRRHPDSPGNPKQQLEKALKYEGDTMGHCVGGYCPDVIEGRSRIYSLRDAKGEPHVTVEVEPNPNPYPVSGEAFARLTPTEKAQYREHVMQWRRRNPDVEELTDEHTAQALKEAGVAPQPDRIVQIKGKQNRAPKEDYLPFVQDFVKGGKFSDVGDLQNTGLQKYGDEYFTPTQAEAKFKPQITEALNFLNMHPALDEHRAVSELYKNFKGDYNSPEYRALENKAGRTISPDVPYTYKELKALLQSPEDWTERGETIYHPISNALDKINKAKKELGIDIPDEPRMAGGGAVSDAKKRLLNMIYEEPHMGIGGAALKAQKAAKAAKKSKDVAPYSQKILDSTTAKFADNIAAANPKLSEAEVMSKATRQAKSKLDWERTQKPELQKVYGALVKSSYADSKPKKLQNTPEVVAERKRKANEFLSIPTESWNPPPSELQAFDRSSIKDALEGFPGVEQTAFPRDIPPRANISHVEELYNDPENRDLIERQIKRGLPLGGETFYASLYPVKQAVMEAGMPAEKFEQWVHSLAPASARNSIMNEMSVGQLMRDMHARGIPLTEENVERQMVEFQEKFGMGVPLMPVHRQGVQNVLEGGQNLREMSKANIPTNYKIPTYGTQKAGDFAKSVVLDVHEAAGQTQGSRFHPYFKEQGGFGNTEYNAGEQGMLGIAQDLGIPGGMAQAGRWFGGGELTGLRSPRGDALDLLEKQVAYTLSKKGIQPNPANVRAEVLRQISTGEGDLLPWYRKEGMPDVRQTGLQRKEGGEVKMAGGLAHCKPKKVKRHGNTVSN